MSSYRVGDRVAVLSEEEILATLDERGCLDDMPFMPEMLQYCGKQFRVAAIAHKTCDTIHRTGGRKLHDTVHLEQLRCDGSAHGGCQADCYLFWKTAWLKPIGASVGQIVAPRETTKAGKCTRSQLHACANSASGDQPLVYSCQTTRLFDASHPLSWWDVRQYVQDVRSGNSSLSHAIKIMFLASLRFLNELPFAYRLIRSVYDRFHLWLMGRPSPNVAGRLPHGVQTPKGELGLQPGEVVRVKPAEAILATLGPDNKNRGLSFDPEMEIACGKTFRVKQRVTKIVDERSGKMLTFHNPCIILEGVVCLAEYSNCRLLCPRAIPSYWRELWLERVSDNPATAPTNQQGVAN